MMFIGETKGANVNEPELKTFIHAALEKFERVKKDFSHSKAKSDFLKKAYPVLVCGHHQIDMDLARNLYKPIYSDENKAKPEERTAEELRRRIVCSVENGLERLSIEARFQSVDIDLIAELRAHPMLRDINHSSQASVRVIIHYSDLRKIRGK